MTHRFHPLRGRALRIHDRVTVLNVPLVRHRVEGPAGPVFVSVPVSWTSLRHIDDFERVSSGRSLLRPDDLEALRELVDCLLDAAGDRNQK
ncbi:MAG: DUF5372 family protein [Rhodospirillales bacterium]|nr:DUF5372 family protein [Rhodospirillales bacterium]